MKTNLNKDKYQNDGWGLSIEALTALEQAMDSLDRIDAIEFGSGISTEFLLDYQAANNKPFTIDSFDNDKKYKHARATLTQLMQCKDKIYHQMFANGKLDWAQMKRRWWRPKTRQRNCFYGLRDIELKDSYNLAIIDGPHGNGRNFAFLLLKDRFEQGFILIDDFNHYDFVETAEKFFDLQEVARVEAPKDNFVLFAATAIK